MRRLTFTTLLIGSALVAGMGYNMPAFSDIDADDDGKITQQEFDDAHQRRMTEKAEAGRLLRNAGNAPTFSDIDTDDDRLIDKTEFSAHQKTQLANRPIPKARQVK